MMLYTCAFVLYSLMDILGLMQFSQLQKIYSRAWGDHTIVWYPDHQESTTRSNNNRGHGHKMGGAIIPVKRSSLTFSQYGWCGGVVHLWRV